MLITLVFRNACAVGPRLARGWEVGPVVGLMLSCLSDQNTVAAEPWRSTPSDSWLPPRPASYQATPDLLGTCQEALTVPERLHKAIAHQFVGGRLVHASASCPTVT